LSKTNIDTGTLRRASKLSYLLGIWALLSVVIVAIVVLTTIFQVLTAIMPSLSYPVTPTPAQISAIISSIVSWFDSIFIWIVVIWGISFVIAVTFGYYTYKVGQSYDVTPLKVAGFSFMLVSFGSAASIYGLYVFVQNLPSIATLPVTAMTTQLYTIMGSLSIGGLLSFVLGLMWIISFTFGLSNMKKKTGINTFGSAMICVILFFLAVPLLIGIFLYGSALSQVANQEEGAKREKATAREGTSVQARRGTGFCPYCGAKVEPDSLFCPTCGSSLKKEG
jgi:hypothetical protein